MVYETVKVTAINVLALYSTQTTVTKNYGQQSLQQYLFPYFFARKEKSSCWKKVKQICLLYLEVNLFQQDYIVANIGLNFNRMQCGLFVEISNQFLR